MKDFITQLGKDGLKAAYSALEGFALYITLALIAILAIAFIVVKLKAPEKLSGLKSLSLGIVIGYAITLSACISFFMVARLIVKEEIDANFYLMLGFFALMIIYALAALITKLLSDKAFTVCNIAGVSLSVAYGFVLLFVLPTAGEDYAPLSAVGMYIFSALLILAIAVPTVIWGKDKGEDNLTKSLSFAGISIALSFALSYVKLFSLPQGGSITLASMLPLIIYAYVFGARKGVFAGVIYGVLQCLQSPQIYQPMQVLLDYPIAFGALGLAGLANRITFTDKPVVKFVFGAAIALFGRYCAHVISGYYVFSSWAMEGYTALSWALVYNLFIIAELAIVLIVGCFMFSSKSFMRQLDAINPVFEKQ